MTQILLKQYKVRGSLKNDHKLHFAQNWNVVIPSSWKDNGNFKGGGGRSKSFEKVLNEGWSSQKLCNCVKKPEKLMVWTRDCAIPVRCSNQLSYEATDVASWSIVASLRNCITCIQNCKDHPSFDFISAVHIIWFISYTSSTEKRMQLSWNVRRGWG